MRPAAIPFAGAHSVPTFIARARQYARSPKGWLLAIFGAHAAVAIPFSGGIQPSEHVAIAILAALASDIAIGRLLRGRWHGSTSPILTGTIVAFVLGYETAPAITIAVATLASLSKHALRGQHGHVFNPAALALLVAIPAFGIGQSWWGAFANLPTVWTIGMIVVGAAILDRLNKFPLALTFLGAHYGLFAIVAFVNPTAVADLFRPPYTQVALFAAAYMLTDPPTAPGRTSEQIWIGALVGAIAVAAQLLGAGQAYVLLAILAGNVALFAQRSRHRAALRNRSRTPGQTVTRPTNS